MGNYYYDEKRNPTPNESDIKKSKRYKELKNRGYSAVERLQMCMNEP